MLNFYILYFRLKLTFWKKYKLKSFFWKTSIRNKFFRSKNFIWNMFFRMGLFGNNLYLMANLERISENKLQVFGIIHFYSGIVEIIYYTGQIFKTFVSCNIFFRWLYVKRTFINISLNLNVEILINGWDTVIFVKFPPKSNFQNFKFLIITFVKKVLLSWSMAIIIAL